MRRSDSLLAVVAGTILLTTSAYAREPVALEAQATVAMKGFMTRAPERLDGGKYRTYFSGEILPNQTMSHDPWWDWGDCTSRALSSWHYLREMTGDTTSSREVEDGQLALLLTAMHPDSGLVCVPEKRDPAKGEFYHIWDQGRTITALAQVWTDHPGKRTKLTPIIDRMVEGLARLATVEGVDDHWGKYRRWPSMAFVNTTPVPDGDWGSMGVPLTIQGLVLYGEASGKRRPIELAKEFAAGILADRGHDQGRHFGEDGGITAHVHSGTASAIGVAALGRYLMTHGERDLGRDMLIAAKKTYDWLFAADNPYRGSRDGWIPEHRRQGFIRLYGEICCTADVIELAGILADSSGLDPAFAGWTSAYDDVASMAVNTLALSQFRSKEPRYHALLEKSQSRDNIRLATKWTDLKLNTVGGWEHEIDGGRTYSLHGKPTISQILWSVGYDGATAGFIRANSPAVATRLTPIEPLKVSDGRMTYRCRTEDKALEISGTVSLTNGVTAHSEIRIRNTSGAVVKDLSYAAMVNFDFDDWVHTRASADAAKRMAIVGDSASRDVAGLRAPGAAAIAADDFEVVAPMLAAANVRPSLARGNCNTVSGAGWRWKDLKPGDSVTLSYDMALGRNDAELRAILSNGTIPSDFPAKVGPASVSIPDRYDGAWLACFPPNDLTLPRRTASGGVEDWTFIWGCCMYAGARGLGAAWESAMTFEDGALKVNCFMSKHLKAATLTSYTPKEGKVKLALDLPATTLIRVPGWLAGAGITSRVNGKIVRPKQSGAYLDFGRLPAGSTVTLSFPLVARKSHEYIGGDLKYALNGFGEMFAPVDKQLAYDLIWRADYVESMDHPGKWPVFP